MSQIKTKWIEDGAITTAKLANDGTFNVSGIYTTGDSTIGGDFRVTGDATVNGDLHINGDATILGSMLVNGPVNDYDATFIRTVTVVGDLHISNDATIGGSLLVNGPVNDYDATFIRSVSVVGDMHISNDSTVLGNSVVQNKLGVGGDSTLVGGVWVGKTFTVGSGDSTMGGGLSIAKTLTVTSDIVGTNSLDLYSGDATVKLSPGGNPGGIEVEGTNILFVSPSFYVSGDIYTAAWSDYASSATFSGWSSITAGQTYVKCKTLGKLVFTQIRIYGTSNSPLATVTLPFTRSTETNMNMFVPARVADNGSYYRYIVDGTSVYSPGCAELASGDTTVQFGITWAGPGGFTSSGTKVVETEFWYHSA